MSRMNRRQFLNQSAGAATVAAGLSALNHARAAARPNERVNIAVMGVNGRGKQLAIELAGLQEAHVVAVCDVDAAVIGPVRRGVEERQVRSPPRAGRDEGKLL